MIIYHYYSTYTVFTSFVSKIFFVLTYFSQIHIRVEHTLYKTQEHFDRQGKTKRGDEERRKTRKIDTEFLLFIQKDRLLFWLGVLTQSANLVPGISHTVRYSVRQ